MRSHADSEKQSRNRRRSRSNCLSRILLAYPWQPLGRRVGLIFPVSQKCEIRKRCEIGFRQCYERPEPCRSIRYFDHCEGWNRGKLAFTRNFENLKAASPKPIHHAEPEGEEHQDIPDAFSRQVVSGGRPALERDDLAHNGQHTAGRRPGITVEDITQRERSRQSVVYSTLKELYRLEYVFLYPREKKQQGGEEEALRL